MSEGKIRAIFESENKWLRCKDVIEKASELGIGRSTVYFVLRKMVKEGTLEKDRKKRKESSYRLKPETLSIVSLLKFQTVDKINDEVRKTEKEGEEEILKRLCSWIGVLSLYTTLKHIRKGEPLEDVVKVATYYIENYPHDIIKKYIINRETPLLGITDEEWWAKLQLLMSVKTGFEDHEEYLPALERFEETLEKMYSEQVKELDKIFNEVMAEGK